jgi:hypothetical protein
VNEILQVVADEIKAALVPDFIPEFMIEGDRIRALGEVLEIEVRLVDRPGANPGIVHLHVISRVLGYPLDACIMGYDQDRAKALAMAAAIWRSVAFPPILSTIYGEEILGSRHSHDGLDSWAVPGRHSFIGPLANRSKLSRPELEKVVQAPLFRDAEKLVPEEGLHLAKVTLYAQDGQWVREVEADGENNRHCELGFQFGVKPPETSTIITCFAVFGDLKQIATGG